MKCTSLAATDTIRFVWYKIGFWLLDELMKIHQNSLIRQKGKSQNGCHKYLFSSNTYFKIRPFVLLPTNYPSGMSGGIYLTKVTMFIWLLTVTWVVKFSSWVMDLASLFVLFSLEKKVLSPLMASSLKEASMKQLACILLLLKSTQQQLLCSLLSFQSARYLITEVLSK